MNAITPMTGMLRNWNDERGFGFIRPDGAGPGSADVFVHISDFVVTTAAGGGGGVRPVPGEKLQFDLAVGRDGKPRAVRVRRPGETLRVVNHTASPAVSFSFFPATTDAGDRHRSRRHDHQRHPPQPSRRRPVSSSGGGRVSRALGAMALVLAGVAVFSFVEPWWAGRAARPVPEEASPSGARSVQQVFDAAAARQRQSAARFSCDGRTYCSQMTSCDEATFFLRNCPGVKMDGNNDGVPCEQQWCGR